MWDAHTLGGPMVLLDDMVLICRLARRNCKTAVGKIAENAENGRLEGSAFCRWQFPRAFPTRRSLMQRMYARQRDLGAKQNVDDGAFIVGH